MSSKKSNGSGTFGWTLNNLQMNQEFGDLFGWPISHKSQWDRATAVQVVDVGSNPTDCRS